MIEAWFDGVCEPRNPGGHGAAGALVQVDGVVRYREGIYIGCGPAMSNNVAEYFACAAALSWIKDNTPEGNVLVRGDSKLVINQLLGLWRMRGGLYTPYYQTAASLLREVNTNHRVRLLWVPREENAKCDELSKQVLRERGIIFRLQPELRSQ